MLSRPPNNSETGLPTGIDQKHARRQRPLKASFNRENNPCHPG